MDHDAPLSESCLAAVLEGDGRRAFAVVDDALAAGHGARELYLDVFQPALREAGRLWQEGRATVAEEHLATAITLAAMARVYDRSIADRAGGSGPELLAGSRARAPRRGQHVPLHHSAGDVVRSRIRAADPVRRHV